MQQIASGRVLGVLAGQRRAHNDVVAAVAPRRRGHEERAGGNCRKQNAVVTSQATAADHAHCVVLFPIHRGHVALPHSLFDENERMLSGLGIDRRYTKQ